MNAPMQQKLIEDLPHDRSAYPHQYDVARDQILIVRLAGEAQEKASFLDDRVLPPNTQGAWFTWDQLASARPKLADRRPHYIFHMGHCGSTLVSRLISEAAGAIAMREPLPLRAFAFDLAEGAGALLGDKDFTERFSFFESCWARGERPVIVKATSICTDLAEHASKSGAQSLFLYQIPETHLAALLAGANTLIDLRGFAQMRHRRLQTRFAPPPLSVASLGELAAQLWLCEASAAAKAHDSGQMAVMNFEGFLGAPSAELGRACSLFGLSPGEEKIEAALGGPTMRTYSKAPEHAYSPAMRKEIIADAANQFSDEIRRGRAYLEAAGNESDAMARALELFSV